MIQGGLPLLALLISFSGNLGRADGIDPRATRTEWYRTSDSGGFERYLWQADPGFHRALVYFASTVAYDGAKLGCFDLTDPESCLARMDRCPKPKVLNSGNADAGGQAAFLSRFVDYAYCTAPELFGAVTPELSSTPVYNSKLVPVGGAKAYLADSYAVVPRAIRRELLAILKQQWNGLSCPKYNANRNIQKIRRISGPAGYYDCAYRDPTLPNPTSTRVPYLPRDRGSFVAPQYQPDLRNFGGPYPAVTPQPDSVYTEPPCTQPLDTVYFTGPSCSGRAMAFIPYLRADDRSFYRVRPRNVATNAVIQLSSSRRNPPYPPDLALLNNILWNSGRAASRAIVTSFFTEILDRTIYYLDDYLKYDARSFRRSVRFDAAVPESQDYLRPYGNTETISSILTSAPVNGATSIVTNENCYTAAATTGFYPADKAKYLPPGGNLTPASTAGQFIYLDQIRAGVTSFSGYIMRHYRDVHTETAGLTTDQEDALITNELPSFPTYRGPLPNPSPVATPAQLEPYYENQYPYFLASSISTTLPNGPSPTVREYWSEDEFGDKSGILQATMCLPGEQVIAFGRNDINYGLNYRDHLNPSNSAASLADCTNSSCPERRYCLRYPLSRAPRTSADGQVVYGVPQMSNPLSDLRYLSNGIIGSTMVCEDDPVLMARESPTPPTLYNSATAIRVPPWGSVNFFNPEPYVGGANANLFTEISNNDSNPSVLARVLDVKLFKRNYFPAKGPTPPNGKMSIPSRSIRLGDPNAIKYLPKNYAECATVQLLPENPAYSLGPLAIPARNYMVELIANNLINSSTIPGKAPNCQ